MSYPIRKDLGGGLEPELFSPNNTPVHKAERVWAHIMKSVRKELRSLRGQLETQYAKSVVSTRTNKSAGTEYVVKFGNREAGFGTRDDAEGFARELFRQTHPDLYADNLNEDGEPEPMSTHVNAGTLAALDDPQNNAAGVPLGQEQARRKIDQANKSQRRVQ